MNLLNPPATGLMRSGAKVSAFTFSVANWYSSLIRLQHLVIIIDTTTTPGDHH